jgi:hypothetical protein
MAKKSRTSIVKIFTLPEGILHYGNEAVADYIRMAILPVLNLIAMQLLKT